MLKNCPYWPHDGSEECLMTKGGLYIPMPDHIKRFCKAQEYSRCHHYIKECEQFMDSAKKQVSGRDRRRYERIEGRYNLALLSCDEMGRPYALMTDKASTLDISLGGMRFNSPTDLSLQQMIAFTFGSDFVAPSLTGIGEVMWCEESASAKQYIAGLSFAFVDKQMRNAIANQVGLPVM